MSFKSRFPKEGEGLNRSFLGMLFLLSLGFYIAAKVIPIPEADALRQDMIKAARCMAEASDALERCRREMSHEQEGLIDSLQAALIGKEFSEITTSIGQLEAKRTTLNPNFAALIVFLLKEAGIKRGDTIAIGASASFPALMVATISACQSLDLRPLAIISLGASQWGANDPDFHWLKMQECFARSGTLGFEPIAISLGGNGDVGEDMPPAGLSLLREAINKSGVLFLYEPDLEKNVSMRLKTYEAAARGDKLKAFVNIGGSYANMGIDSRILEVEPGLSRIREVPSHERCGVIFAMARNQIPVIHLLFIKGLAEKYGLPWNPEAIPLPGEGNIYSRMREKTLSFSLIGIIYLFVIWGVLLFKKGR
jgi:poly-gamma-glutamate system protein